VSLKSLWKKLVGVQGMTVEDWDFDDTSGALILSVRPSWRKANRCSECGRRSAVYDQGGGRRQW